MVVRAEKPNAVDRGRGPHYCDPQTKRLAVFAAQYEDLLKLKLATTMRGMDVLVPDQPALLGDDLASLTSRMGARVSRELRRHPVWPWLSVYPGLGGVHTARLIGYLRCPHRFPGARSIWHYCGLHVVNGRAPRPKRGEKFSWNPGAKTAVLQPGGIAEHIVRSRVPVYRDRYDETKQRLQRDRGAGGAVTGSAVATSGRVDIGSLRPFQIDAIARKVAAKAFVADLWRAWSELPHEGGQS